MSADIRHRSITYGNKTGRFQAVPGCVVLSSKGVPGFTRCRCLLHSRNHMNLCLQGNNKINQFIIYVLLVRPHTVHLMRAANT